jgi:hypothetical protein
VPVQVQELVLVLPRVLVLEPVQELVLVPVLQELVLVPVLPFQD